MKLHFKFKFLLKNILKGLLWMAILAVLYLLAKEFIVDENKEFWLKRFYSQPLIIYGVYVGSEVFFGLFQVVQTLVLGFEPAVLRHQPLHLPS